MRHSSRIVLGILAVVAVTVTGATAAELAIANAEFKATGPAWSLPDGPPFDPRGDVQLADPGGTTQCCMFLDPPCTSNPGPYDVGDTLDLNTYWSREFIGDAACTEPWDDATWTQGLQLPTGQIFLLFQNEPVNFGDLCGIGFQAGDVISFCVVGQLTLPPQGAGFQDIQGGFTVDTSEGSIPPTFVSTFSIN